MSFNYAELVKKDPINAENKARIAQAGLISHQRMHEIFEVDFSKDWDGVNLDWKTKVAKWQGEATKANSAHEGVAYLKIKCSDWRMREKVGRPLRNFEKATEGTRNKYETRKKDANKAVNMLTKRKKLYE